MVSHALFAGLFGGFAFVLLGDERSGEQLEPGRLAKLGRRLAACTRRHVDDLTGDCN